MLDREGREDAEPYDGACGVPSPFHMEEEGSAYEAVVAWSYEDLC